MIIITFLCRFWDNWIDKQGCESSYLTCSNNRPRRSIHSILRHQLWQDFFIFLFVFFHKSNYRGSLIGTVRFAIPKPFVYNMVVISFNKNGEINGLMLFLLFLGKEMHNMVAHLDAVTSLSIDSSGLYILSGSKFFIFSFTFLLRPT